MEGVRCLHARRGVRVERRRTIYYLRGAGGELQITTGVHVGECVSSVRDLSAGAGFMNRWCARFGGRRAPQVLNAPGEELHDLLGMRIIKDPETDASTARA